MTRQLRRRLRHLPTALAASAVLLVIAAAVGAWARGGAGAAGAAAGVGLVAASYTLSSLVIAWIDAVNRNLLVSVTLFTYAVKFTMIGFGMAALSRAHWAGLVPMGISLIAAVVTWASTQAWWTWHARVPYVEFD